MGCSPSKPAPQPHQKSALDLERPAEVPCGQCGSVVYIDAKRRATTCFKCSMLVSRWDRHSVGLKSGEEHMAEKREREAPTRVLPMAG